MDQGLWRSHFCEGIGRSCGKLCSPLHTVLVAQVIYSTVVVHNYWRHVCIHQTVFGYCSQPLTWLLLYQAFWLWCYSWRLW